MTRRHLLLPLLALAGCSARPPEPAPLPAPAPVAARPALPPFDAELTDDGPGQGLTPRRLVGYDPALPGFVVEAQMGTLALRRWSAEPMPDSLVLVLHTSAPRLEHLVLTTPEATVATASGAGEEFTGSDGRALRASTGTYFGLDPFEGGVRVVLRRPALELLGQGGRVEWVDVFR
jgi:hypothetical protein